MEVLILGTGCTKCVKTYEAVKRVVEATGVDATIKKVEDIMEIMQYNVMSTPAVIVNGEVKIKGYIPSDAEIRKLLGV